LEYNRNETLETHAYELIKTTKPEEILDMRFDVIIGNSPYQLSDGGQKASVTPIYQKFIQQAKKLNPRFLSMVVPARWFSGGRGLDSFREEMLNDKRLRSLTDHTDSNDCFPGVDIGGGIWYFLWERDYKCECEITNILHGKSFASKRKLNDHHVFIRYGEALPIFEKVRNADCEFFDKHVNSQKPFGLRTYAKPTDDGDITLHFGGRTGKFWRSDVPSKTDWIDKWKVIISYLTYDHAGRADKDCRRRIFSTMEVLPPLTVCTESWLVVDTFDDKTEAENLFAYLGTDFVRFLVTQLTSTQYLAKANITFVPVQDFTEPWTDEKLYAKYGITEDETSFIECMICPMELNGGGVDE
jgi:site-specific DNA-methyltransferase (adenine-specific)